MPLFSDDPDALEIITPSAGVIVQSGSATFSGAGFVSITPFDGGEASVAFGGSGFFRFVGNLTGALRITPMIEERFIVPRLDARTILPKV